MHENIDIVIGNYLDYYAPYSTNPECALWALKNIRKRVSRITIVINDTQDGFHVYISDTVGRKHIPRDIHAYSEEFEMAVCIAIAKYIEIK